jgi:hypothetical protein
MSASLVEDLLSRWYRDPALTPEQLCRDHPDLLPEVRKRLEALAGGPRSLEELAAELYRGFPESVLKLARLQIHAGLIELQREGRVAAAGDRWQRR